jgi:hypothetical protein
MTYAADIDALNPSHAYALDGNANDRIAANNGSNSGGSFTGVPLCEGVSNSYLTDGISDRISLPSVTTINNAAQDRKAVSGWFSATAIQNPPKSIYGEGDGNQSFRIILGWGNNLVFEVDSSSFTLQIFGDVVLDPNRAYHLCAVFEGNGFGNEFRGYLDGVKQLDAAPPDRQPDAATLTARSVGEIGDPSGTVAVGGVVVTLLAPINGQYNEWNMFDGADAVLTDTEARELFEKGALPDATITNQAGLDSLAGTVRSNAPCCIRITGNGTINLSADNVTFDPLASIHVQYTGTGTVNWTNINGSDASIGSVTEGGTINFINPAIFTLNGVINGAEVRIYDDEIADPYNFDTELAGIEANVGTTFAYAHGGLTNTIVIQHMADGFKEIIQRFTINDTDQSLTLFPDVETNA